MGHCESGQTAEPEIMSVLKLPQRPGLVSFQLGIANMTCMQRLWEDALFKKKTVNKYHLTTNLTLHKGCVPRWEDLATVLAEPQQNWPPLALFCARTYHESQVLAPSQRCCRFHVAAQGF